MPFTEPSSIRRKSTKKESQLVNRVRRRSDDHAALGAIRGHRVNDGREWYWSRLTTEITAQIYGSVVPRCLIWAVLGAAEGVCFKHMAQEYPDSGWGVFNHHTDGGGWFHPYSMNIFGMMLGWTLVMRIQIAYQRYWEGATHCHLAVRRSSSLSLLLSLLLSLSLSHSTRLLSSLRHHATGVQVGRRRDAGDDLR